MNAFDDQGIGSLLDYVDQPANLDLGAIVRAGRRRRHRRRAGIAGVGALSLAAAGGLAVEVVAASQGSGHTPSVTLGSSSKPGTPSDRLLPATVEQSDDLLADHPPVDGSTTTIVANPDGWRAVAYVDAGGDLCFGSVDPAGTSQGACAATGAFGNAPIVDNASGPNVSAAATAPASEAPAAHEVGVFGMVTTGESEPNNIQRVAHVVVGGGDISTDAMLSPTAAAMGGTGRLAGDERVWFAWVPSTIPGGALRISSYTTNGELTGSQPLWFTSHDFETATSP
jgi:hypothetical protein